MPRKTEFFKCPDCGQIHGSRSTGEGFRCSTCKKQYQKAGNEAGQEAPQSAERQTPDAEETPPDAPGPEPEIITPPKKNKKRPKCTDCGSDRIVSNAVLVSRGKITPGMKDKLAQAGYTRTCVECLEAYT